MNLQKKTFLYSLTTAFFLLVLGISIVSAGSGTGYLVDDGSAYGSTDTGWRPSAIVVGGFPAISYIDYENQNLMYVRATNADGTSWGTPIVVADSDTDPYYPYDGGNGKQEMRIVNGNPAIAFYTDDYELAYVRASNSTGSAWNDPILVDDGSTLTPTSDDLGYELSMEIVNGRPAIAHQDESGNDIIYFIRADDINGNSWSPANEVVIANLEVDDIELITLSNGYPAVSFVDENNNNEVWYVRASDVNGASWETPVDLDTLAEEDELALTIVNGNPAVAYYDVDNEIMYYMRATDALGDTWPANPVTVRDNDYVDSYHDMIIYQGVPTIAYQRNSEDQTQDDLALIQANDANGTSWKDPQILIANNADTGKYNSMLVNTNGNLVIATYEENTDGDYSLWAYAWQGAIEPDTDPPTKTSSVPANGATLSSGPTQMTVTFNEDVKNDSSTGAANTIANYLLVEAGTNGIFDTTSCAVPGGNTAAPDDKKVVITNASYTSTGYIATLTFASALPEGKYRLFVCGTTSIEDLAGNELNGGTSDTTIDFSVRAGASSLPDTGFRHGEVTQLPNQPAAKAYASTAMTLEIPKLNVSMPIVGVAQTSGEWDVTWLGNSAGYLYGSAFPTWAGNTVITGHVWDAYNRPGAFAELKSLNYGDQVEIHAWGLTYTYEVRESKLVTKKNTNVVFQSEQYDWLTLVTCEFYNPFNGEYLFRRAVRAVLVSVQ
jgi:LPXTG-site transpeptidase (sortase) family protein